MFISDPQCTVLSFILLCTHTLVHIRSIANAGSTILTWVGVTLISYSQCTVLSFILLCTHTLVHVRSSVGTGPTILTWLSLTAGIQICVKCINIIRDLMYNYTEYQFHRLLHYIQDDNDIHMDHHKNLQQLL